MTDLSGVNKSELIQFIKEVTGGNVSRSLTKEDALYILDSVAVIDDEMQDCIEDKRTEMQQHIAANYRRLRTQLPGCNGKCREFGCPDIIVQRCWSGFKRELL